MTKNLLKSFIVVLVFSVGSYAYSPKKGGACASESKSRSKSPSKFRGPHSPRTPSPSRKKGMGKGVYSSGTDSSVSAAFASPEPRSALPAAMASPVHMVSLSPRGRSRSDVFSTQTEIHNIDDQIAELEELGASEKHPKLVYLYQRKADLHLEMSGMISHAIKTGQVSKITGTR